MNQAFRTTILWPIDARPTSVHSAAFKLTHGFLHPRTVGDEAEFDRRKKEDLNHLIIALSILGAMAVLGIALCIAFAVHKRKR